MTALSPSPGSFHIDGTVGGGGHTLRILEAASPDGRVLGLDADPRALGRTRARLAGYGDRLALRHANFGSIRDVAQEAGFGQVDGVLLDLGLSSYQLAERDRGFSFRAEGPLDMRFDPTSGAPASELIATLDEDALTRLLRTLRRGAACPADRARHRRRACHRPHRHGRSTGRHRRRRHTGAATRHPSVASIRPHGRSRRCASRSMRELDVLPRALEGAMDVLRPGGVLVVISYHSLEDRIVKRFVAAERRGCICPPVLPVCVCGRDPAAGAGGPTAPDALGRRGRPEPACPQREAARGPEARRMSGHRASRRREYGRRQKDVRGRRREAPAIDLDPPTLWVRGRAWGDASTPSTSIAPLRFAEQSSTADGSAGSQGR